jgi:lysophospholipase L1-like esterase
LRRLLALLAFCLFTTTGLPPAAAAQADSLRGRTYIALGDSSAFGYAGDIASSNVPSFGVQGYVLPFFESLVASDKKGLRGVINLAIPGETLASFFGGGNVYSLLNLNYASPITGLGGLYTSQKDMLLARAALEKRLKRKIDRITVQFGANELLGLLQQHPEIAAADPATQQAVIGQVLAQVAAGYSDVLALLRALAPDARVFVVGYPNPRPESDPLRPLFDQALVALNGTLAAVAFQNGAYFVDVYTSFVAAGPDAGLISSDLIHPSAAGYARIGQLIIARDAQVTAETRTETKK